MFIPIVADSTYSEDTLLLGGGQWCKNRPHRSPLWGFVKWVSYHSPGWSSFHSTPGHPSCVVANDVGSSSQKQLGNDWSVLIVFPLSTSVDWVRVKIAGQVFGLSFHKQREREVKHLPLGRESEVIGEVCGLTGHFFHGGPFLLKPSHMSSSVLNDRGWHCHLLRRECHLQSTWPMGVCLWPGMCSCLRQVLLFNPRQPHAWRCPGCHFFDHDLVL